MKLPFARAGSRKEYPEYTLPMGHKVMMLYLEQGICMIWYTG
jgi:hypothetical protein